MKGEHYTPKDNFTQSLRPANKVPQNQSKKPFSAYATSNVYEKKFKPQRMASKSKRLNISEVRAKESHIEGFSQKSSSIFKNRNCYLFEQNLLQIDLGECCQDDGVSFRDFCIQVSLKGRAKKISNIFSKDYIDSTGGQSENLFQLVIKFQQFSIEDANKVKKTYPITCFESYDPKSFKNLVVKLSIRSEYQALYVYCNKIQRKIIKPSNQQRELSGKNSLALDPWAIINQSALLLKSKMNHQRPQSKINWCSETVSKQSSCDYYGLGNQLPLSSVQNNGKEQINVFCPNKQEKQIRQNFSPNTTSQSENKLKRSSIQSIDKNSNLRSSFISRKNSLLSTAKKNTVNKTEATENEIQGESKSQMRRKSSFKNLKEKNEYFLLKESQRKKSIRKHEFPKDLQITSQSMCISNPIKGNDSSQCFKPKKSSPLSSSVKLEYGIQ